MKKNSAIHAYDSDDLSIVCYPNHIYIEDSETREVVIIKHKDIKQIFRLIVECNDVYRVV